MLREKDRPENTLCDKYYNSVASHSVEVHVDRRNLCAILEEIKENPMKHFLVATTALTLLVAPIGAAFAQGMSDRHDDRQGGNRPGNTMMMQANKHADWHKGGRIATADWNRGLRVSDYNRYHLSRPPRGYEWRRVDNNYVLAAAATGLIAGLVLANQ
jgi:Ni/Co efflux regulator RcnB